MKIVFTSRTGNVASFVDRLELDAVEIITGNETIEEEFVLITYTDGDGELPYVIETFLEENHAKMRGVAASGNVAWEDSYCLAADVIHEKYNVPIIGKFEDDGTDADVEAVKSAILAL